MLTVLFVLASGVTAFAEGLDTCALKSESGNIETTSLTGKVAYGKQQFGWVHSYGDGNWYYFDEYGNTLTDWERINGTNNKSCRMAAFVLSIFKVV